MIQNEEEGVFTTAEEASPVCRTDVNYTWWGDVEWTLVAEPVTLTGST